MFAVVYLIAGITTGNTAHGTNTCTHTNTHTSHKKTNKDAIDSGDSLANGFSDADGIENASRLHTKRCAADVLGVFDVVTLLTGVCVRPFVHAVIRERVISCARSRVCRLREWCVCVSVCVCSTLGVRRMVAAAATAMMMMASRNCFALTLSHAQRQAGTSCALEVLARGSRRADGTNSTQMNVQKQQQ